LKYSGGDRIKTLENAYSKFTFIYDELGHITEFTDENDNVTIVQTTDDSELLRNLKIKSEPYDLVYNYNIHGKLTSVKDNTDGSLIATILYYENGMIRKKTLGNNATTLYEYHEVTKLPKVLSNFYPNGTLSSEFRYFYDKRGHISSMQTSHGTWNFSYDLSGQLTGFENPSNSKTFIQYDQNRNRIAFTQNGVSKLYQINNLNQYVSVDNDEYTYDMNGNLIFKPNLTMEYGIDDRLTRFVAGNTTCQLQYSALGHLRRKICDYNNSTYLTDLSGKILKQVIFSFSCYSAYIFLKTSETYFHAQNVKCCFNTYILNHSSE
jgi:YD repeat-containing protein